MRFFHNILILIIFIFVLSNNDYATTINKENEQVNSIINEDVLVVAVGIPGLYLLSDQPKYIGAGYLLAAVLGVQGKTVEETTAGYITLGLGSLYNFTRTNAATREEVFWTNVGLWSGFALYNHFFVSKNDNQTNDEIKNGFTIQPMLGNQVGLACSYNF